MSRIITIGTRGSKLAMWQAESIADQLEQAGMQTKIIPMETRGDKVLDVSISKIGSKGVFTEELEDKLRAGEIDIAVHSAKDLQSNLADDLEIIAFGKREKANDVLVSNVSGLTLNSEKIKVGTSSTRRVATLRHHHPHVEVTDMRGNLQTRVAKMERGDCDALILAFAGVHRMGMSHLIQSELALHEFVPAVGQGSIAIEAAKNLVALKRDAIRDAINDTETEICLTAERSFLKKLEGGCSIPVYAHAILEASQITMKCGIISLDGQDKIEKTGAANSEKAIQLGEQLAYDILNQGGDKILYEIREALG
ncbi:MAG: hydroxymethylbilane synthase [Cyclobacteriaceae bacterium]